VSHQNVSRAFSAWDWKPPATQTSQLLHRGLPAHTCYQQQQLRTPCHSCREQWLGFNANVFVSSTRRLAMLPSLLEVTGPGGIKHTCTQSTPAGGSRAVHTTMCITHPLGQPITQVMLVSTERQQQQQQQQCLQLSRRSPTRPHTNTSMSAMQLVHRLQVYRDSGWCSPASQL
jgi:hypothetical protein